MPSIEQHGVDIIPESERTSLPQDLISILIGSNLCLGVIIFGWLPVSFGLSWWPSVTSLITGTVIGTAICAPLALISLSTATNLSTSSGAAFGVRGRLIGSSVGLLLSLGYIALTLWTGGDVMIEVLARVTDLPINAAIYCLIYTLLASCTAVGAIYGYRILLSLSQVLAIGMIILLLLGLFAYAPSFTMDAPTNTTYLLGSFWPTWLFSAVSAGLSGPVAFITLLGDYTRYISPLKHSSKNVLRATYVGLIAGLLIPQLFGAFVALATKASTDFASPLVAASPSWYLMPLLLAATAGSIGNAGVMLYSMGLDLDAILPRATRVKATLVVAVIATFFVFLGHFALNAQSAMTSFVLLLTAIGTPWAVITLMAHKCCNGIYDKEALQIYNRRAKGGIYWFYAGWNIQATVAWAFGALIGLCAVSTPLYEGPLTRFSGGLDLSFVLSGIAGGVVYLILLLLFPQTASLRACSNK
jgi:purine-cytosine permease-like protein